MTTCNVLSTPFYYYHELCLLLKRKEEHTVRIKCVVGEMKGKCIGSFPVGGYKDMQFVYTASEEKESNIGIVG